MRADATKNVKYIYLFSVIQEKEFTSQKKTEEKRRVSDPPMRECYQFSGVFYTNTKRILRKRKQKKIYLWLQPINPST